MRNIKFVLGIIIGVLSLQLVAVESAKVNMHIGSLKMLPIKNIIRVAIGKGDVVSTKIIEGKGLLLIAENEGSTELRVWREGERESRVMITVTQADTAQLMSSVRNMVKQYSGVNVRDVNGVIILEGVALPDEIKAMVELKNMVPNLLNLVKPIRIENEKMIKMELKIVEFSKKQLKNLGVKWDSVISGPAAGYAGAVSSNNIFGVVSSSENGLASQIASSINDAGGPSLLENANYGHVGIVTGITSRINLLVESGDAKLLAEPMLSTRSGHPAEFLAGGEFPITVPQDGGTNTIEFKEYGIRLDIEPIADEAGNIKSSINAEVSSLDYSVAIDNVPGLLSRKTKTVISVKNGETIVLSGLVNSQSSNTMSKFPFLGDIPIIGELFKSTDFQANRSEMVIFVTPKIVDVSQAKQDETLIKAQKMIEIFNSENGINVLD